jgi:S-adenosylmethionine hydrolase
MSDERQRGEENFGGGGESREITLLEAFDRIVGEILRIDRFGNLVTNIDRKTFDRIASAEGHAAIDIQVGPHQIGKVVSTYADAAQGELCALFGSSDHLEIASNGSSAAGVRELGRGAPVRVARRA